MRNVVSTIFLDHYVIRTVSSFEKMESMMMIVTTEKAEK